MCPVIQSVSVSNDLFLKSTASQMCVCAFLCGEGPWGLLQCSYCLLCPSFLFADRYKGGDCVSCFFFLQVPLSLIAAAKDRMCFFMETFQIL